MRSTPPAGVGRNRSRRNWFEGLAESAFCFAAPHRCGCATRTEPEHAPAPRQDEGVSSEDTKTSPRLSPGTHRETEKDAWGSLVKPSTFFDRLPDPFLATEHTEHRCTLDPRGRTSPASHRRIATVQ